MAKLHELLAVEGDLETTAKKIWTEASVTFSKKAGLFNGSIRRFEPFDENDKTEYPEERTKLESTVKEKLDYVAESTIRYFDAMLQKERTNQDAKADLIVDGVVIGKDLPATFLLGLETRLKNMRQIFEAIPTLAPGIQWEIDPQERPHVYKRVHPDEKFKTQKTFQSRVLYDAVVKDGVGLPAQIEKWEETENVGKYITDQWSGMISSAEKSNLLTKLDKLIREVKKARQRANMAEVHKINIGKEIFNYITDI